MPIRVMILLPVEGLDLDLHGRRGAGRVAAIPELQPPKSR